MRWYIAAVLLPYSVYQLTAVVLIVVYRPRIASDSPKWFATDILLNLPLAPLWEEIAWRAFAYRGLKLRYSPLTSSVILGVFWSIWHIPFWAVVFSESRPLSTNETFLLSACAVNIAFWSVIWAFVYDRSSQSLPVVILLHATYNAAVFHVARALPHLTVPVLFLLPVLSGLIAASIAIGAWGKWSNPGEQNQGC